MLRFDVFLCHNSADKPAVMAIGERLKKAGVKPWLDQWELRPGLPWQDQLQAQIEDIGAAAVFVGKNGEGPWQKLELQAFLQQFVDCKCPVIPVILPDYPKDEKPKLPPFLRLFKWVDFRQSEPDPVDQLIWGITGTRPVAGQVPRTAGSTPQPPSPAAPPSRRSWRKRISMSIALGLAGILVTLAAWWLPRSTEELLTPPISIYAVRIVVLGPEGRPVEGSEVHASVGREPQRVPGGWELEIPAAKLPQSRKVEIRAEDPASSATGKAETVLGHDPNPVVKVHLVVVEARIRGLVVGAGGRALAGVRVSVPGYEGVVTNDDGIFDLEAHAPRGLRVRLHAEAAEAVKDQYCFAGSDDCQIRLVSE